MENAMHHVEKLCNILYVLLFGILLIVVMGLSLIHI